MASAKGENDALPLEDDASGKYWGIVQQTLHKPKTGIPITLTLCGSAARSRQGMQTSLRIVDCLTGNYMRPLWRSVVEAIQSRPSCQPKKGQKRT
mmetsp:Transcript_70780/g.148127  ORF Transcript_70780/g.148127 Transcript_70780/m.148127 type:complete len:95 (-) Transcript_70780:368-652(-)